MDFRFYLLVGYEIGFGRIDLKKDEKTLFLSSWHLFHVAEIPLCVCPDFV